MLKYLACLAAWLSIGLGCAAPAQAQLGLPRGNVPNLPRELPRLPNPQINPQINAPVTAPTGAPQLDTVTNTTESLQALRRNTVRNLLRDHADVLEADPAGEPIRRQELLLSSPAQALLDTARAAGFVVLRDQTLPELDMRQVVLRVPAGMGTAEALRRLRALDPQLEADFNHVYTRSGDTTVAQASTPDPAIPRPARRVGLIDSGVDHQHAALRDVDLHTWGCDGALKPSAHGTAVASLLVGRDAGFSGVAPGSVLYAADIYCGQEAAGGAAESIVAALAWMARERVPVVNISLVGPANRALELGVRALNRKGHLIVAAVGNDGPAAPPLYPASYPDVIGVTGVTPARRVLPEAAQGMQVSFAAPGSDLAVARPSGGYVVGRGTSFAAPLVAGVLCEDLREPDVFAATAALKRLAERAMDLGAPGRDTIYGNGLVAEQARVAPERVQAQGR